MSNCRPTKSRLGRYHDCELPPDERLLVERHLEVCRTCRDELAEIRSHSEALQQTLAVPPVPEGMVQRIMNRVRLQPEGKHPAREWLWFWRNWSIPMRFAASVVAAAAFYIGIAIGTSQAVVRPAGDEMQWIGLASRGPLITAYVEDNR